jgi:subtilisin family serine protease
MLCLLTLFLTLGSSGARAADSRYIVVFREGTPLTVQERIVALSGSTIVQRLSLVNAIAIELPLGRSVLSPVISLAQSALNFLLNRLEVEAVEVDAVISAQSEAATIGSAQGGPIAATNTPPQSAGGYTWNLHQIDLDVVDRNVGGRLVEIAVLDTGIDPSHPHLAEVVVGGYNARARENPANYMDHHGHGTHVAGIIAAAAGLPYTPQVMRGVAPQAHLYAVRVLDDAGGGYVSDLVNGLSWVFRHPTIRVVNMSVGFYDGSIALKRVVKLLYNADVVMVASAGNCEVVAASSEGSESEGGESEGGESEGGESITSMNAGLYGWASGTSQAAPHVTGIVALMRSVNPLLTPASVLRILQETTLPLNAPREAQGAGLVNAPRAVAKAKIWR